MKEPKIHVLLVEPEHEPVRAEIDNTLKSLQNTVGGSIECIYPYEEPVGLVCNEEGKIMKLPLNRALRMDGKGPIFDIVAGTFFIAGCSEDGNFRSLTEDEFKKFEQLFKDPEMFIMNPDGGIQVMTVKDVMRVSGCNQILDDLGVGKKNGTPRRTSLEDPGLE